MLISAFVLGPLLIAAFAIGSNRTLVAKDRSLSILVLTAVGCIAVQAVHFSEEWATGFHVRFPELFGLNPMLESVFLAFNMFWILLWMATAVLLWKGRSALLFTLWFLGMAAVLNLVFHPLAAWYTGGYFPGLYSSFFVGTAGIVLIRRLAMSTVPR